MSLVKRFVVASLATVALSALHAEPRCRGTSPALPYVAFKTISSLSES